MKIPILNPVMSTRIVLNSMKQKICRMWAALPKPLKMLIMFLALFTPIAGYWAIRECELRKNQPL